MTRWHNLCVLLMMILIQTDRACGQISVRVQRSADTLTVSCRLLHDEKVNQVNWELLTTGSDVMVKLGTFHPQHGVHVEPQLIRRMEIQGDAVERSSLLEMTLTERGKEEQICCVFNTFPSGVLKKCANITHTESSTQTLPGDVTEDVKRVPEADPLRREEEEEGEEPKDHREGLLRWCLLVAGCLVYLSSICICVYYVWRCCYRACTRKRVYEIHKHQNISSVDSEGSRENPLQNRALPALPAPAIQTQTQPQAQSQAQSQAHNQAQTQTQAQTSQPKGFDPSKLYAKIKLDLLYGRLWKTYQGSARTAWTNTTAPQHQPRTTWTNATPPHQPEHKAYSLLGELGPVQGEDRPSESTSQTGPVEEPGPPLDLHGPPLPH